MLFFLGDKEAVKLATLADLNKDNRVNLIDCSILVYNWGIPKDLAVDLNGDGKINIVDCSIMAYYWTG